MADEIASPADLYTLYRASSLRALMAGKSKCEWMMQDYSLSSADRALAAAMFIDLGRLISRFVTEHEAAMAALTQVTPPTDKQVAEAKKLAEDLAKVIATANMAQAFIKTVTAAVDAFSKLDKEVFSAGDAAVMGVGLLGKAPAGATEWLLAARKAVGP